jgi:AcrR family transcriptional regulator
MNMSDTSATQPARPGRPRCFCEEIALDAALGVFWEKSYEGASLTDLTEAMGINRPSLYATFGDKESLFRQAMERYAQGPGSYIDSALAKPTAREVIASLLLGAAQMLGDKNHPRGCFSLQGGLAAGIDAESVQQALTEWRKAGESRIRQRLKRAQAEGDLSKRTNVADLTRYIAVILNGLGVQSANGATRAEMLRVANMALASMAL